MSSSSARVPPTFWLPGLPGAGKSTLAHSLAARLRAAGQACVILDGDEVRRGLSADLGFSPEDRAENVRRVAELARILNDNAIVSVVALISPLAADRERAREAVGAERFIEVFVDTSLSTCEQRDPKGLYRRARAGAVRGLTGIDAPYERPARPDVHLLTETSSVEQCIERLLAFEGLR